MNLIISDDQFKKHYLIINEAVANTVIENSKFNRIIYSTEFMSLNGIFISCKIKCTRINKYFYKFKCCYNISENLQVINTLKQIEKDILSAFNNITKTAEYSLAKQLDEGMIKIFVESNEFTPMTADTNYILKISGIWETNSSYGITYKFLSISHQ